MTDEDEEVNSNDPQKMLRDDLSSVDSFEFNEESNVCINMKNHNKGLVSKSLSKSDV